MSTRYFGHQVVEEARELFPATEVPRDFDVIEIPFPERGSPELIRAGARARRAAVASDVAEGEQLREFDELVPPDR